MRIEHQRAEAGGVAAGQQLRAAQHALILADRVRGAVGHLGRQSGAVDCPLRHAHIAQRLHRVAQHAGKVRGGLLARFAQAVIGAVHERVLGVGVAHQEADLFAHGDGFARDGTEVGFHQPTGLAGQAGNLVEQAALAAGIEVLGLLADPGQRDGVGLDAVQARERQAGAHLQRGGAGEPAAQRNVAEEHAVKTVRRRLSFGQAGEGALDVVLPGVAG